MTVCFSHQLFLKPNNRQHCFQKGEGHRAANYKSICEPVGNLRGAKVGRRERSREKKIKKVNYNILRLNQGTC